MTTKQWPTDLLQRMYDAWHGAVRPPGGAMIEAMSAVLDLLEREGMLRELPTGTPIHDTLKELRAYFLPSQRGPRELIDRLEADINALAALSAKPPQPTTADPRPTPPPVAVVEGEVVK